jgi:flagellar motor protein MotB
MSHLLSRLSILLIPAAFASGCSSHPSTAQLLNHRLETSLAPDIAAGRVSLQQLPNGTRMVFADSSLFAANSANLADGGRYALASAVEGLLDPSVTDVHIADSTPGPLNLQDARTQAVTQYFTQYGLDPMLQSRFPLVDAPAVPGSTSPSGLTITALTSPG